MRIVSAATWACLSACIDLKRQIERVGRSAAGGAADQRLVVRRGLRCRELALERDHVGVNFGIAARPRIGELALDRRKPCASGARARRAAQARDMAGVPAIWPLTAARRSAPPPDRCRPAPSGCARRSSARSAIRCPAAIRDSGSGSRSAWPRPPAAASARWSSWASRKRKRLARLVAVAGEILLDEDVDQLLDDLRAILRARRRSR